MSAYRRLLSQNALTQSMSRKGNCLDNAAMESFFGTLKSECFLRLHRFHSIEQLQAELNRYIHYYNHDRIKLKLKAEPRAIQHSVIDRVVFNCPTS